MRSRTSLAGSLVRGALLAALILITNPASLHAQDDMERWRRELEREREQDEEQRRKAAWERGLEARLDAVVTIRGDLAGAETFGAGIIVGRDADWLYVVTANHVVRRGAVQATNLRVTLKSMQARALEARVLEPLDRELDLAVVGVRGVATPTFDVCAHWFRAMPMPFIDQREDDNKRGARVYPVGNPNGVPWVLPARPDSIVQLSGSQIVFQTEVLSPGHSGGGLFTERGRLAGMITKDAAPFGSAVIIERVLQTLQRWRIPVQLEYEGKRHPASEDSPLHEAVRSGNVSAVKQSLSICDPNTAGSGRYTFTSRAGLQGWFDRPLHIAAQGGHREIAALLLKAGADVNAGNGPPRETPLHYAAQAGHREIAALLLKAGADVNARTGRGETPLHYAAREGNVAIISLLVSAGANVNAKNRDTRTPLAIAVESKRSVAADLLRSYGAAP